MKNTYKNHVSILLDRSSSMSGIINAAVKVFNQQIDFLRNKSLSFEQETRVSFYTFGSDVKCEVSDVDVARPMTLDSVTAYGNTAMLDCIGLAIEDCQLLPQKYGDHSFFLYVITDGEENYSRLWKAPAIKKLISTLPDNYTVAAFVPSINAVQMMVDYGFPKGCVEKWDTTERGIKEVGQKFEKTMDNFFEGRKKGVRSSTTVFSDLTQVTAKNVTKVLDEVKKYDVVINEGVKAVQIRDLVEAKLKAPYTKGGAFYELVKNEHVGASKEIAIQNKKTGKIYSGNQARGLLNLPDQEVKIVPGDFGEWIVYVQSTSVNRNVIPKQRILVLK
jgi:uncharacterized protein YegL